MKKQRVELLAPAGTFESFRAAVNAGADAVYLGGEKFGARAYAGNFSKDEIVEALSIAHIFERKIYLTVNTLVKESEFPELVPYIAPLYEAGLDGVIVQDMGVLECMRDNFPDLELHASTQMAITGAYGASYLKRLGVSRVVPARELSLDEIRDIKEKTGLEVECFVHGAMCYAYSGQCLFSSILGGRSGNRGRCAGPCRLPYAGEDGKDAYPLSLKDMYTLPILPKLIQAGVDSFKIEGRMKSPEYVAGVTSVYRKYIDRFLADPKSQYIIEPEDEELLRGLYIRSDICTGYYHRHNGRSMVTLKEPGYSGSSQDVLKNIQESYLAHDIKLPVTAYVRVRAGERALLTLACDRASVTVEGDMASVAVNRPLDEDEISKKIGKLGDTYFELSELSIDTDNASFMPVRALNELRRMACKRFYEDLCGQRKILSYEKKCSKNAIFLKKTESVNEINEICILTNTVEQLLAANAFSEIRRIYVNSDIFIAGSRSGLPEKLLASEKEYILALPHIFRKRSFEYIPEYESLLKSGRFAGVMARNFEELEWLREIEYDGIICSDYTVYAWNNASLGFLSAQLDEITLPLELNKKELGGLSADSRLTIVVYGFIPLMYSANCVSNMLAGCSVKSTKYGNTGGNALYHLTDRYKNVFMAVPNCLHCYNIIYNAVPLSLHGQLDSIAKKNYNVLRLDFSIEDGAQTQKVIDYYLGLAGKKVECEFPYRDFTNGHYKRGVE